MKRLLIQNNLDTSNWKIIQNELHHYVNILEIGFLSKENFKNLSFGFELRKDGNIKQYDFFPKMNSIFLFSDQDSLSSNHLKTKPDEIYELFLWSENNQIRSEKVFTIQVPKPPQPHESWNWDSNSKLWISPIPYPSDGKNYNWNEDGQKWIEIISASNTEEM